MAMERKGKRTAILDADITGPSIPKAFGLDKEIVGMTSDGALMMPVETMNKIQVMSANLLLDDATDPVIWRGPVIASR